MRHPADVGKRDPRRVMGLVIIDRNGDKALLLQATGNATCALHHTIPGDVAQVSREEVEQLMKSRDFRVKR